MAPGTAMPCKDVKLETFLKAIDCHRVRFTLDDFSDTEDLDSAEHFSKCRKKIVAASQLSSAQARSWESHIREAFKDYAVVLCRRFCRKVYTKLPRELRDEVYRYLTYKNLASGRALWVDALKDQACRRALGQTHQLDEDFVGTDMAREIAEYLYANVIFIFGTDHERPGLWINSVDNHGVLRSNFLKNVMIDIQSEDLCFHGRYESNRQWISERISAQLKPIFECQKGTTAFIFVRPDDNFSDSDQFIFYSFRDPARNRVHQANRIKGWERDFVKTIRILVPHLDRLQDAGYNVRIFNPDGDHAGRIYETILGHCGSMNVSAYRKMRQLCREVDQVDGIGEMLHLLRLPEPNYEKPDCPTENDGDEHDSEEEEYEIE